MPPQVRLIERGATAEQTREVPITQPEFLIGRGPDCDLCLPVTAVSRHHCMVRIGPGDEVRIIDLGSSNGTYVNGQRVRSQTVLASGDQIKVGPCIFLIHFGDRSLPSETGVDPLAVTQRLPKENKDG
jgi:pSer/pThr/pTyr-binding forkhead associated (FHA) protein